MVLIYCIPEASSQIWLICPWTMIPFTTALLKVSLLTYRPVQNILVVSSCFTGGFLSLISRLLCLQTALNSLSLLLFSVLPKFPSRNEAEHIQCVYAARVLDSCNSVQPTLSALRFVLLAILKWEPHRVTFLLKTL